VWAAILTEQATSEGLKLADAVAEVRTTADHLVSSTATAASA
jgi:hypothetical protein